MAIGTVDICVNLQYSVLCNDTLNEEAVAEACQRLGYSSGFPYPLFGSTDNFQSFIRFSGVQNLSCPYRYFDGVCDYSISMGSGCVSAGGPAIITCVNGMITEIFLGMHMLCVYFRTSN